MVTECFLVLWAVLEGEKFGEEREDGVFPLSYPFKGIWKTEWKASAAADA